MHVSEKVDINLGPSGFATIIGSCAKPDVLYSPARRSYAWTRSTALPKSQYEPGVKFQEIGPHQPSVYPMRHKRFCA